MSHFKDAGLNPIPSLSAIGLNELLTTNILFNQGYPKNCIFECNTRVAMVETFAINLSCKTELLALRAFEKTDALYYGFFDFVHLSNSTSIVLELAQLKQHATKKSLKL